MPACDVLCVAVRISLGDFSSLRHLMMFLVTVVLIPRSLLVESLGRNRVLTAGSVHGIGHTSHIDQRGLFRFAYHIQPDS